MSTNPQDGSEQPTVVLVHGAWADGSSWNDVIERLQAQGVQVTPPANPLRGISIDSAYIASYLEQIPGPVLAVGHSYGGAVITNAATNANNVLGLVYVAAFVPDEGETLADIAGNSKDSIVTPALRPLQYPTGERAGATITDVEGSHVIMMSQPQVVVDVILTALAAVSQDIHPTT